jgi:hypothetical protein
MFCRQIKWPLVLLSALLTCGCASSQDAQPAPKEQPAVKSSATISPMPRNEALDAYVKSMRDDLSRGKVGIITEVMQLNSEEAKVFWPIYQDYESELFELGDHRVQAIRQFATDIHDHRLTDSEAGRLANEYFDYEAKRLELLKRYHGLISEKLSPVRAAQFTQIEHRVGTIVDLLIAAEIPLLAGAPK